MERLAAMANTTLCLSGACGHSNVVRCLLFLIYRLCDCPTRKLIGDSRGFGADYSSGMVAQEVAKQQVVNWKGGKYFMIWEG